MKIRISDLPPQGLRISGEITLEALNSRLNHGHQTDIRFTSVPQVEVMATPNADGAEVIGKVKTKYLQPCGRCADEIERELEVDLSYILKPKPAEVSTDDDERFEDDLGMLFFSGDHIDLESAVQESLIVSLSLYWSPEFDNEKKCSICGKKPKLDAEVKSATTTSFGSLLKKAGVN